MEVSTEISVLLRIAALFCPTLTAVALAAQGATGPLGTPLTTPWPLNANAGQDCQDEHSPQVVTDGHGLWVAVWTSRSPLQWRDDGTLTNTPQSLVVSRSTDDAATWTDPTTLATVLADPDGWGGDPAAHMATDDRGQWVVVWHSWQPAAEASDHNVHIWTTASTDSAATWSEPKPMNTSTDWCMDGGYFPRVTSDGLGLWIVTWTAVCPSATRLGLATETLLSRSTDNGSTWSPPQPLDANAAADNRADSPPQLATDTRGAWVAVWHFGQRNGGSPEGIMTARSADNGANWGAPQVLQTDQDSGAGLPDAPDIAADSEGNWIILWDSGYSRLTKGHPQILVARSSDNGVHWSAPQVLSSNAALPAADNGLAHIATDGRDNWVAAWTFENYEYFGSWRSGVLLARSTDYGETWTPPEPLEGNASPVLNVFAPQLTTDADGHWLCYFQSAGPLAAPCGLSWDIVATRFVLPDDGDDGISDPGWRFPTLCGAGLAPMIVAGIVGLLLIRLGAARS